MLNGSCYLSVVPVRVDPSGKSTMVNQLLFGDPVFIIEEIQDWYKIESQYDHYEGWCEKNQIELMDEGTLPGDENHHLITSLTATFSKETEFPVNLVYGSSVMVVNNRVLIHGIPYKIEHGSLGRPVTFTGENIVSEALKFMGCPYLWGGRSPFGIDCSGLTQLVYKVAGKSILRDAWQQAQCEGEYIDLIAEAKAGDLAFFDNDEGRIIHTGILTGESTIIHAHGKVRIDPIDHYGIYDKELGEYSHKLRIIKRFSNH